MFIELTIYGTNEKVLVNVNHVVEITTDGKQGTKMYLPFDGNNTLRFEEYYNEVKEKIAHATGKEVF